MNALVSHLRSPLGVIALNVVVIHAAGLVLLNQSQAGVPLGGGGTHRAPAIHVRLAQAAVAPSLVPAPADTAESPPAPPVVRDARPTAQAQPPAAPEPEVVTQAEAAPFDVDTVLAGLDDDLDTNGPPASDSYIPRSQLTVGPRTNAAVLIPFPPAFDAQGRFSTVLALFIDERGIVRRVRVEGPALPPSMEEAATQTFLQTQFQPGEVQGQAVKSLIHIEVVFDNTPVQPHQPAQPMQLARSM